MALKATGTYVIVNDTLKKAWGAEGWTELTKATIWTNMYTAKMDTYKMFPPFSWRIAELKFPFRWCEASNAEAFRSGE